MRRTLSVCLSVCPVIVAIGHVFSAPLASRTYFSACTEGRISYGHLGRTESMDVHETFLAEAEAETEAF